MSKAQSASQTLVATVNPVIIIGTFHRKPNAMRVLSGESHDPVMRQFQPGKDNKGNALDHITLVYDQDQLKARIVRVNGHYELYAGETTLIGLNKGYDVLFFTEAQCKEAGYVPKVADEKAESAAEALGV